MTCSQAKVSKELIKQAATNFMKAKLKQVFDIQEPYIQGAMERTWWQKLLGKPARTREEAITYCNSEYYWEEYTLCEIWGWRSRETLENLVSLCNITQDEFIMLTPEDAAVVYKYA